VSRLKLLVPSRGRPEAALELAKVFLQTRGLEDTSLTFCIDATDPTAPRYFDLINREIGWPDSWWTGISQHPTRERMVPCLNREAYWHANYPTGIPDHPRATVIGFMGDDHRPRTKGWDVDVMEALRFGEKSGVAYGNDLVHGPAIPTAAFITADLVRKLGYMAPPGLTHMYADNFWRLLGEATSLTYLPNTVIEHMHPIVGKAEWSEQYAEVNGFMEPDRLEYERYLREDWPKELVKLQ
jgi:hypothetical protein